MFFKKSKPIVIKYEWFVESTMRLDRFHAFNGDRTICLRRISKRDDSNEWCQEEFAIDKGITASKLLTAIFHSEQPKNLWVSSYKYLFFGLPFERKYGSQTYTTQHAGIFEQHAEDRANYLKDRLKFFI